MSMPGGSAAGGALPPIHAQVIVSTSGTGAAVNAMGAVGNAAGTMGSSVLRNQIPIRTMGDAMRQTASLMKYTVLGAFQQVGSQAVNLARQFDLSMSRIQGLVGVSAKQVEMFSESVLQLAGQTARSPIELAESLYFITSAGIKGATALDVLKESAESAAAGLGETNTVADALTSVLNAYGQENLSAARANDILVATVREGKAEADQFAPALGKVLPIAAAFGASFEDVSAGVAALTRNGSTAGTSAIYLRQVMSQLLKPSKQAADAMFAVGTSAEDIRKRVQEDGLLNALEYLNAQLGGSETEVAAAGLTKVFGNVRALQAVVSLLGPNLEENRKIFAELNDAVGDGDAAFQAYTQTADYKFKQSLASSQTAMIQLGREIMPVVTFLLDLSKTITDAAGAMLSFFNSSNPLARILGVIGKTLLIAGASAFFFTKGALGIFRTFGSLTRLFSNTTIVLQGVFNGIRGNAIQANAANLTFQGLIMTQNQEAVALQQLTAASANNNLTMRQGLLIMAENNTNLTQKILLTRAAAAADNNLAVSEDAVRIAAQGAAAGTNTFGASVARLVPQVMVVATILMTAWSIMSMFKKDKGPEKQVKTWGEITDLLNQTISYAKTGITINVDTNVEAGADILDDETRQKIKEQLPKEFDDAIKEIPQGSEAAQAYLASIVTSLNLKPGKDRDRILAYFEEVLAVSPEEVLQGVGFIENIGDAIGKDGEEVGVIAGSNIIIGLQQGISKYGANVDLGLPILTAADAADVSGYLATISAQIDATVNPGQAEALNGVFREVGKQIGIATDKTKDFGQILLASESVVNSIQEGSVSSADAFQASKNFFTGVFSQIKTVGDLVQDEKGNFQDLFNADENKATLESFLQGYTGSAEGARLLYKEVTAAYDAAGDQTPIEAFNTLQEVIKNTEIPVKELEEAFGGLNSGVINDIADEFTNGLSPAIQYLVDDYEAATAAIENFEKGQKAVMGINKDFVESQIEARDAFRDLSEALGESGGKIDQSVAGDKAKTKIIKAFEAILDTTNILRATEGPEAAVKYVTDAYDQLSNALVAGGTSVQDAQKFLDDIGFKISGEGSLIDTLFGSKSYDDKGQLDQTLLSRVREGIDQSVGKEAQAAKPALKKFNDALLQQIKDYWKIASPSKRAAEEIGNPIGKGIVDGITSSKVVAYMGQRVRVMTADTAERLVAEAEAQAEREEKAYRGFGGGAFGMRATVGGGNFRPRIITGDGTDGTGSKSSEASSGLDLIGGSTGGNSLAAKVGKYFKKGITDALAKSFLKKLDDFQTPVLDLIDRVISDSGDALSTLGDYIDAQIDLQDALNENLKLTNTQLGYQAELNRTIRERDREARRTGANFGTEVTDYEQARIEELQKAFEDVSRNYALRRASIADVIDAEDKLNEARIAASEVSQDQIDTQNDVLDAQFQLRTKGLETSKSIYEVVQAQLDLTEAAINFKINAAQSAAVFQQFADQAFPGLDYRIKQTTGQIFAAGIALSDDNGIFLSSIKGLGQKIFDALAAGVREKAGTSSVLEFVPPASAPAETPAVPYTPLTPAQSTQIGTMFQDAIANAVARGVNIRSGNPVFGFSAGETLRGIIDEVRLNAYGNGGLVTKPELAIVGEKGPELIIPLRGMGTATALENLTPVSSPQSATSMNNSNQVINIVVNNPVPETASDSISNRMKALSTSGLFG